MYPKRNTRKLKAKDNSIKSNKIKAKEIITLFELIKRQRIKDIEMDWYLQEWE